jgi:sterol 3beta-glucosyltransferase
MRIALLTHPGRGDTEPFIALALRLRQGGHTVKLTSRPDLADVVGEYGLDFLPIGNPYQPFIAGAADAGAMGSGHPLAKLRFGIKSRTYVSENLNEDALAAAEGSDAIIYKWPWISGHTIAEKLGIPCIPVMLMPLVPTAELPAFVLGRGIDRGPFINKLVWRLPWQVIWSGLRYEDGKLRRQLGLRSLPRRAPSILRQPGMPVLCPWSPAVLPAPRDWPEYLDVTGYWFLDPPTGWQPPTDLVGFIEAGPKPICIGFGSMVSADRHQLLKTILDALELSGQRAVLLSGWGQLGKQTSLPDTVFCAESIPHSWLFPQMAAVVHHGGAGTAGAGFRSGIPQVICPFVADQPSWAKLAHRLGVGPALVPFDELTARRLADALTEAVTNPQIAQRAQDVRARVGAEDGVGRAADLIHLALGA